MQHTTVFDTHAAIKRLKAVGVDEPQAEVLVDTCHAAATSQVSSSIDTLTSRLDTFATKADLRADLAELRADLKTEIVYTRFYSIGSVVLVAGIVKALDFLF